MTHHGGALAHERQRAAIGGQRSPTTDTTPQSDQSDADLVDRVRQLWNRHHDAGLRAAAKITRRFDAEDLVQEAFVRILSAICRGRGPPQTEALVAPPQASERSPSEQDPGPAESSAPDAGTVAEDPQAPDDADVAAPVADAVDTAPDEAEPTPSGTASSPQPPTAEDPAPPAGGETDGGSEEQEPPPPEPQPVTPPTPRVDGLAQSLYLPELRGTAEPGADVIAVADGVTLAQTTADAQGAWTATLEFDDATADPTAVTVYQEVDGRRSEGTPVAERIVLQAPTVVGVSTAPSPTVTVAGTPETVAHVAVDGLVTTYQHTLDDQPVVRALLGLSSGSHVVAVRYADPSTGRYGAWARTEFTIP